MACNQGPFGAPLLCAGCEKRRLRRTFPFQINSLFCFSEELRDTGRPCIALQGALAMKTAPLVSIALLVATAAASAQMAQTAIYRCAGNLYTTDANEAKAKSCPLMSGGNITVVQGTKPNGGSSSAAAAGGAGVAVASAGPSKSTSAARVEAEEQRAR